jgi:CRISPR/Cas system CSM-associated protein Csm3 (group 7 of RAMP superfamily)
MSKGWHVLRFIIEAKSPISCTTGTEGFNDTQLARDANGLPMIPGTTLQGVFRNLCDEAIVKELFGFFGRYEGETKDTAHPARLFFSNAQVLGSDGKCAPCHVIFPANAEQTDIFEHLKADAPLTRDHVKINELGAVDGSQKYDRAAVPKGTRFAFEVMMIGTEEEKGAEKKKLVNLFGALNNPFLRFGGRGRRGYGSVVLKHAKHRFFLPAQFKAFRDLRASLLSDLSGLSDCIKNEITNIRFNALEISVTLSNINPWRTGHDGVRTQTGHQTERGPWTSDPRDEVDMAPTREPRIDWTSNGTGTWKEPTASIDDDYILMGTSLAGPLSHRALFHFNRRNEGLIDDDTSPAQLSVMLDNQKQLRNIFGEAADDPGNMAGLASALFIEDINPKVVDQYDTSARVFAIDHIGIDRFAGSVFQGQNFAEEVIAKSKIDVKIWVDQSRWQNLGDEAHKRAKQALCDALFQLSSGGLALGAKSSGAFKLAAPQANLNFKGPGFEAWTEMFRNSSLELSPKEVVS